MSFLLLLLLAPTAHAQVNTAPRRAGQSAVRWADMDWSHLDLLQHDVEGEPEGGVRFFFYEAERPTAERAIVVVEDAYRDLERRFEYTPERRFPFFLYSSYHEFLQTNLFPLSEGTLGVTSTRSLEVTLPYLGDHRTFRDIARHELTHEFTIQKVRSLAAGGRDPLDNLPLWLIEGLAEYYAHDGIDPETRATVRDMVTNPDIWQFHGMPGFFDDVPGHVGWTYKAGQVRVAFLEETYGAGTIQRVLEATPKMVSTMSARAEIRSFPDLLEDVTGDRPQRVEDRYAAWIKRQAYEQWLDADQTLADAVPIDQVPGWVLAFDASTDGRVLLLRTIEGDTGRTRLVLVDAHGGSKHTLSVDGRPGTESLHPIDDRNFDVTDDAVVFVQESHGADVLEWRAVERVPRKVRTLKGEEPPDEIPFGIRTHDRRRFRVAPLGLVGATSPVLSPDGTQVAFVGLAVDGTRDVWVLELGTGTFTQRTDDVWAERHLAWDATGIIASVDRGPGGLYGLYRVDEAGEVTPLAVGDRDYLAPTVLSDGRLFFTAADDDGPQLNQWVDGTVVVRTDLTDGVLAAAPGPDGDVWMLVHHKGDRLPVRLPPTSFLDAATTPAVPEGIAAGEPPPTGSLDAAVKYNPYSVRSWRGENIFGFFGAGPGGVYGQLFVSAADQLRDRAIVLQATMFGSPRLTDGYVAYLNQGGRFTTGGGPFQYLRFRVDTSVPRADRFTSIERFFGGFGVLRIPIDRFVYLQLDQSIGAVDYLLLPETQAFLPNAVVNTWEKRNGGLRPQSETTLRLGVDTIQLHRSTGPIAGSSLLVEGTLGAQLAPTTPESPLEPQPYGNVRLDVQHYVPIPLGSGTNLGLKASGGTSFGGRYARSYFLSSYDTLRGARFGDIDTLLGRHYWFTGAELQVPLDAVVRVAFLSGVEGVVGVDLGGASDRLDALWDERVLDVALGTNLVFGPLVFRMHWARAVDVGAPLPVTRAPWVPNLSLSWLQL